MKIGAHAHCALTLPVRLLRRGMGPGLRRDDGLRG
jgi:hypothetical protein